MPLDITKPEVIKFLVESYEKTAYLRMKWNVKHEKILKETARFKGGEQKGYTEEDVTKSAMIIGLETTIRDHISGARNKRKIPPNDDSQVQGLKYLRKGHSIPEVGLGNTKEDPRLADELAPSPPMRPVPCNQKQIIYDGIPNFGRLEYIKVRNRIKPEDKFYFKLCGGWDYGWRLKDSYFGRHAPSFPRHAHLTKGSVSRSGPQPDPEYYKYPDSGGVNKCSM